MRRDQWIVVAIAVAVGLAMHLGRSSPPGAHEPPPAAPAPDDYCDEDAGGRCLQVSFLGELASGREAAPPRGQPPAPPEERERLLSGLARLLEGSDAVIGGLGGAATPDRIGLLRRHRVGAVSLATKGAGELTGPACDESLRTLAAGGLAPFGLVDEQSPAPYRLERAVGGAKFRLAVLGAAAREKGAPPPGSRCAGEELDVPRLTDRIRQLKAEVPAPYVVVYASWGRRNVWKTGRQQEAGRALLAAGADLVVGHGAGVLQEVERHEGGWLVYGLGSFGGASSPQPSRRSNALPFGGVVRLTVTERDGVLHRDLRLYPTHVDEQATERDGRLISVKELGDLYWRLLLGAWKDDRKLKQRLRPGWDGYGRHLELRTDA